MGFRKLTADLAWIQTVIYYGTEEEGTEHEEAENGGGRYPLFLAHCQRVARIDPNYKYVFYYGGSALGWNLNRLDEAETLLKEGVMANPKEWRFQQFLAGLAFQKNHNINSLIDFLKVFIEEKDCPNLLRSILANIYKKQGRYLEAIHVWMIVYDTQDPNYIQRAASQILELAQKAHIPLQNRP
jgi:tetratricopeptide (TPR) repeat protein